MTRLPPPPPEPAVVTSALQLAPKFRTTLADVMITLATMGWHPTIRETLRSTERAAWLYGFGREYDDGRGIVTDAHNALKTWHHYGLAADLGDRRFESGSEPERFFVDLGTITRGKGLTWGGDFPSFLDKPHVQFGPPMRLSPSDEAATLLASGGVEAVWRAVGAI